MLSPTANNRALARLCGQLIVGGFEGTAVPPSYVRALVAGERGGVVVFSRNLANDPWHAAELARAVASNSALDSPPLVAIDQEGGRVARLTAPVLEIPPMAVFGRLALAEANRPGVRPAALALAHDAAAALGAQLAALGITMNFAPVLDVHTRAENPIIGDRAFGSDPELVAELGLAWARGLREGGVLACGKHFPGHGDTTEDSHLDLPLVDRATVGELEVDLLPFRRVGHSIAAFMTAHVVYPCFDREVPATFSSAALSVARAALGPAGCILSDDLEMKAVADRWSIEESAVRAVEAGCDALLVCRSEELQERAIAGLVQRARSDGAFRARVEDAHARFLAMRRLVVPAPAKTRAEFDAASARARAIAPRMTAAFPKIPFRGAT